MNSFSYRLPFSLFFLPQLRSNPNLAEISTKTLRMIKIKRFTSLFLIRLIHAFSGLSGFPYKISEPNQNTISSASRTGYPDERQRGNLDSISMALAATKCWFIWKERCLRVFENKTRTAEQLAIAISSHFVYWHPNNKHTNHRLHSINHSRNIYWQLPPANTLKLNCDASWLSEITNSGFGFVIRNSTGTFTAAEHGWCRTFSAEEAEAVAMLKATQWADRHNIQNLIIKRDNQATISYLQGKTNSVKWQCIAVLEEVKVVAAKLVSFKGFQYVDRRANNKVADLLAKDGRRSKNTAFWSDQAPNFLFPAIAFDTVKAYELCNSNETTFVSCSAIVNPTNSVIRRATQHKLVSEESELAD